MTTFRTYLARAIVRLAILAAPKDLADALRQTMSGGGGGPKEPA